MQGVPRPPVIGAPRGKSALARLRRQTRATIKATIADSFTTLDNFVILSEDPTIAVTSGRLTGNGAVRHRDHPGTDDFKVTAVIGAKNNGRTRLVTCASASFDRFYALEVETGSLNRMHILKATSAVSTSSSGIFGILIGLLGFFLGNFGSANDLVKYATITRTVNADDSVAIWWDEANSVIRAYHNGIEVTSLPVDPWEIPHGEDNRNFGVMAGVDSTTGVQFTSIEAADA